MNVQVVDPALTRELRRSVLRPHLALTDALPGDDLPEAVHVALLDDDGEALCTCFVSEQPCPWRPAETAWQLRQMATAPQARGSGYGRLVLEAALAHVRGEGAALLWCNARETAAGFYEACGWERHGDVFADDEHPIPHVRMSIGTAPDPDENPEPEPAAADPARPFGFVGALVLIAGLLPVLIALTSGVWFTAIPVNIGDKLYLAPVQRTFEQVPTLLDHSTGSSGLAIAYFHWLAWALLAATFALSLLAITPHRAQTAFRIATPVLAVVGIVLTTLSLELVRGGDFSFWWRLRGAGYWLAVAGFAVMGAGAALGPLGGRRLHRALTAAGG